MTEAKNSLALASQEKLRFFTQEIVDRFLGCLRARNSVITDHSMIRHFEGESHNTREKIIARMKAEFGIDISSVYHEELPTLLYFIQTNKTK